MAAIAFVVPCVVLLCSVRTLAGFWDTGDLQTVAWIGGIPYPTGYPGYVAIAWSWAHLLPFGSVAARVNALSAISVAAGSALITILALQLRVLAVLAILAGWTFAFAHVIWWHASYADVHPLGFALALGAVTFAVRWAVRGDTRALAWGIVLAAIALAVDNTTLLILAGGTIAALARRWPFRVAARWLAIGTLVVLVAYAALPLRSAYLSAHRIDPTLALGVEPGRPFWDDHHPSTVDGFLSLVAGTEWGPGATLSGLFTPGTVRAAYDRYGPALLGDEPQGLVIAGAIGLGFIAAEAPLVALGLFLAAVVPALFGAGYRAEADPERYVFMLYAMTALGIAVSADRTVRAFGRDRIVPASALACTLLALALVRDAARASDIVAVRDYGDAIALNERVAAGTRPDAVVVAAWDWATALAYGAYVDRALGNRIVLCALPQDYAAQYGRWAATRQVVIVSDGRPDVPGYRLRLLVRGVPQVFEVLPR